VKLGATLGLVTVAEGIESDEQLRWFQGKHCPYGQGYLFQRPATASEITALLVPGATLYPMAHATT
jgi:EAL domain-containing protein (putative c-di-GMP-specific phosphodiesterase class I)